MIWPTDTLAASLWGVVLSGFGVWPPRAAADDVVVGVPGQLGDLAKGVGHLGAAPGGVKHVAAGVPVLVGHLRRGVAAGVGCGVGEAGGAAAAVGDGLEEPVKGRVVADVVEVVGQAGGVAARVDDREELDVLVALRGVVTELEYLGQAGAVPFVARMELAVGATGYAIRLPASPYSRGSLVRRSAGSGERAGTGPPPDDGPGGQKRPELWPGPLLPRSVSPRGD